MGTYSLREHAEKLHREFMVVDGHFDLLMDVEEKRRYGKRNVIETMFYDRFIKGGLNLVVSSIFIDNEYVPEMSLRKALDQISALYYEIEEFGDKIALCRKYEDILKAESDGKIGIMLSFEGVEPLYNDLNLLRVFYELGVRGVGLTWSRSNYAADGCRYKAEREGVRGGLTKFGVELLEEAERLGMFIDVSHLNDEGFRDVIKYSKKPIVASHSNCRSLASTMRNLTDEQIKAIASKGGVIGMNTASFIVADDNKDANISRLADHIDYIVKLAGIEYVGLGFDLCQCLRDEACANKISVVPESFDIIKDHSHISELTEELVRRGYTDDNIELILGKNLLRVYREVIG